MADDSKPEYPSGAEVQNTVIDGLASALASTGSMLTKFVCVVEALDEKTGNREIWTFANPEAMAWEILGLLEYGKHVDIASRSAKYVRQELDGE